jgi:hypothetical protein
MVGSAPPFFDALDAIGGHASPLGPGRDAEAQLPDRSLQATGPWATQLSALSASRPPTSSTRLKSLLPDAARARAAGFNALGVA